jgi:uncharacterized protein (DUF433 family)
MSREIVKDESRLGGKPFLEGTRIRVSDIAVKYEKLGYSIEELLEAYERLERSDIHSALSYFYSNEDEISRDFELEGQTA